MPTRCATGGSRRRSRRASGRARRGCGLGTIKIENPGAVTGEASDTAKPFLIYIESRAGQEIFASHGFRPVEASVPAGTRS